jgi:hypothetical protein
MMNLWNPFAFDVLGRPLAPAAPPALRAEGGQASPDQLAMAQHVFARFVSQARLSYAPNPTQIGKLADGTAYRIVSVAGQQIMQIWPVTTQKQSRELLGGILAIYNGISAFRVWWDGSWRAEAIQKAYFGTNFYRNPSDGSYFCDLLRTHLQQSEPGYESPTKITGLVTSNLKYLSPGIAIQRDGYLLETPAFGIGILNTPESFVFLSPADGGYEIFATDTKPVPSEVPLVLDSPVAEGRIENPGFKSPSWLLTRRTKNKFLVPAMSVAPAPGPALLGQGFRTLVSFFEPAGADVSFIEIGSVPPYSMSASRQPIVTGDLEETYLEWVRTPNEVKHVADYAFRTEVQSPSNPGYCTAYSGYPVHAVANIGVLYSSKYIERETRLHSRKEQCWVRECVDFSGKRYSVSVQYDGSFKKEWSNVVERPGDTATPLQQSGPWLLAKIEIPSYSLEPAPGLLTRLVDLKDEYLTVAPSKYSRTDNEKTIYVNNLFSYFEVDDFKIPMTEVDLNLMIGQDTFRYRDLSPVDSKNITPSISGKAIVRHIDLFEEKNYVTVMYEVEVKNPSVSYLYSNRQDVNVRFELESRFSIFHRGKNIYSKNLGVYSGVNLLNFTGASAAVPPVKVGDFAFSGDLGVIATSIQTSHGESDGNGICISPSTFQALAAPIISGPATTSIDSSYARKDGLASGINSSALEILNYAGLVNTAGIPRGTTKISHDPGSGGCLVMTPHGKWLVSPRGTVTPLAEVTGSPDASLREMSACL